MKKFSKIKYSMFAIIIFLGAIAILSSTYDKLFRQYVPPTDGSNATHYEMNEQVNERNLSFTIEEIEEVDVHKWHIKGHFEDNVIGRIHNQYTLMFGKDDIAIQGTISNVENIERIYILANDDYEYNQIMLVENRSGEIIAVINI